MADILELVEEHARGRSPQVPALQSRSDIVMEVIHFLSHSSVERMEAGALLRFILMKNQTFAKYTSPGGPLLCFSQRDDLEFDWYYPHICCARVQSQHACRRTIRWLENSQANSKPRKVVLPALLSSPDISFRGRTIVYCTIPRKMVGPGEIILRPSTSSRFQASTFCLHRLRAALGVRESRWAPIASS